MIVYEPALKEAKFVNSQPVNDLAASKGQAAVIAANRMRDDIRDVTAKVYRRDLFGGDA